MGRAALERSLAVGLKAQAGRHPRHGVDHCPHLRDEEGIPDGRRSQPEADRRAGRNHQANAMVAIIVGMMIASMIAVELIRICFSALATGPTGSRMPRLQPAVSMARTRAIPGFSIWLCRPNGFTKPPEFQSGSRDE